MTSLKPTDTARSVSVIIADDQLEWLDNLRRHHPSGRIPSRSETVREVLDAARILISVHAAMEEEQAAHAAKAERLNQPDQKEITFPLKLP